MIAFQFRVNLQQCFGPWLIAVRAIAWCVCGDGMQVLLPAGYTLIKTTVPVRVGTDSDGRTWVHWSTASEGGEAECTLRAVKLQPKL